MLYYDEVPPATAEELAAGKLALTPGRGCLVSIPYAPDSI